MIALLGLLSLGAAGVLFILTIWAAIKKNTVWKKYLAGCAGCLVLMTVLAVSTGPTKPTTEAAKQEKPVATTAAPAPAPEPVKEPELSIDQQIEKLAKDAAGKDFKKIVVGVSPFDSNQKVIDITIAGRDNLTTSFIRKGIYKQGADLFQKLYTAGLPIAEVRETITLPLTDKYGNTEDGAVVKMTLTSTTAAKINWDGVDRLAFNRVADKNWTHPSLTKE